MKGRSSVALLALVLAVVVAPALPAQADSTVRLTKDVVHHLDAATLLGPVAPTQHLTAGAVLKNPNEAAGGAYLKSLYDPSSSNYQNFLDPDVFNTQLGVPAATSQ